MTVEAQEMQHHARLLRCERDKWQRHFGIFAIARRIHGERDVPADHPELHALLISVRHVLIDHLAHGAERGAAIRGECGEVWATVEAVMLAMISAELGGGQASCTAPPLCLS